VQIGSYRPNLHNAHKTRYADLLLTWGLLGLLLSGRTKISEAALVRSGSWMYASRAKAARRGLGMISWGLYAYEAASIGKKYRAALFSAATCCPIADSVSYQLLVLCCLGDTASAWLDGNRQSELHHRNNKIIKGHAADVGLTSLF